MIGCWLWLSIGVGVTFALFALCFVGIALVTRALDESQLGFDDHGRDRIGL